MLEFLLEENRVYRSLLDRLILFGERSWRHALKEYLMHHQTERNQQGIGNVIPFPQTDSREGAVEISERLGGLLDYYCRPAV